MEGHDLSADYIATAEAECERLGRAARFTQADMRCLDMTDEFDVVLSVQMSLALPAYGYAFYRVIPTYE